MAKLSKLIAIFSLLCISQINNVFAQKFYIKTGAGYGIPFLKEPIAFNLEFKCKGIPINNPSIYKCYEDFEAVNTSMGKGININMTAGYQINNNFGFEISSSYLKSQPVEFEYVINFAPYYTGANIDRYIWKSNVITITPSFVSSIQAGKIETFLKGGIVLGFVSLVQENEYLTIKAFGGNTYNTIREYNGKMSVGFNTSLGIGITLYENLSFFGEISLTNLSYSPASSEVTLYEVDGKDSLSRLSVYDKKSEYVDKGTYTYSVDTSDFSLIEDIDKSSPAKYLSFILPYNSIGINLGLKYRLSFDKKEGEKVYLIVDQMPKPYNEMKGFNKFVSYSINYPEQARKKGTEGKVYVEVIVNEKGRLTKPKIKKGIGAGCDKEAIRIIKMAPYWKPGTINGKPVKVKLVTPVVFKL